MDSSSIMEEEQQHDFWQHLELQTLIARVMYSNVASGGNTEHGDSLRRPTSENEPFSILWYLRARVIFGLGSEFGD